MMSRPVSTKGRLMKGIIIRDSLISNGIGFPSREGSIWVHDANYVC